MDDDDIDELPLDKVRREELAKAFREVLITAEGKRVLYWLLEQCGIYHGGFTGDNALAQYRDGRRAIGLELLAQLDALDPRLYPNMLLAIAEMRVMDEAAARALNPEIDDEPDDE